MRSVGPLAALVLASALALPCWSQDCEGCAEARRVNGWCEACGVGYVGNVRLTSRWLWHTLDAHGHTIRLDTLACESCRRAVTTDGYCVKSRMGFVGGEAYFSRLTWLLAGAEAEDPSGLDCPVCRENARRRGWCERCQRGRVGWRVLPDRGDFDALEHDLRILELAHRESARCENCAAAMVTDTECPTCRIRYLDGQPLPSSPDE